MQQGDEKGMKSKYENSETNFSIDKYHLQRQSNKLHWHRRLEIIYILSGDFIFYINKEEYKASKGDLLVVNSGCIHDLHSASDNCWDYVLRFNLNTINTLYKENYTYIQHYISAEELEKKGISEHLKMLFVNIHKETENNESYSTEISKTYVLQIWGLLLRHFQNQKNSNFSNQLSTIRKFQNIFDYIDENYTKDINLKDIAQKMSYSTYYTSKLFKQFTNMNLCQYINTQRIKKAVMLLDSTQLSISEIAVQCGYNTFVSFYNNFLSIMKITPSKYRNQK